MFKKATNFLKRTAKKAITSERLKTMALMLVVGQVSQWHRTQLVTTPPVPRHSRL